MAIGVNNENGKNAAGRGGVMAARTIVGALGVLVFLAHDTAVAQGGPPLITDDPDTPGPGYWEINLATTVQRSSSQRRLEAPLADINYGVGRRIQLKLEIPWLNARDGGQLIDNGPAATVGVKWRFLGQEGQRVAWSIYPQFESDGKTYLLPTEITFEIGPIEINGEVGRTHTAGGGGGWVSGLSTELAVRRSLELLGELHGTRTGALPTDLVVDVGARQKLVRQILLLVAVGTAVRGSPEARTRLRLYTGLQFNLPGQYVFNTAPP